MRELIEIAPQLGCDVVATLSGVTPETQQSGNAEATLPAFTATFAEHARVAEGSGVKIALENWPGAHPYGLSRNIAFSPHLWERLFDAVPSPALGLEYDPSHLVRLQIPHVAAIKRFSDRIHHVHAKDTTIRREVLEEVGTTGQGWWRYSIPGRGEVDWNGVFAALREIGYDGPVCIEHEDADFKAEKFDDGLRLGHEFLSRLMA